MIVNALSNIHPCQVLSKYKGTNRLLSTLRQHQYIPILQMEKTKAEGKRPRDIVAAMTHVRLIASTSGCSESFVYTEPFSVPPTPHIYPALVPLSLTREVGKQTLRVERCSRPPTWKAVDSSLSQGLSTAQIWWASWREGGIGTQTLFSLGRQQRRQVNTSGCVITPSCQGRNHS